MFFKFTEINEIEEESWNFYIDSVYISYFIKLNEIIKSSYLNNFYKIEFSLIDSNNIPKTDSTNYLCENNLIRETLNTNKFNKLLSMNLKEIDKSLYKGGIVDFFD